MVGLGLSFKNSGLDLNRKILQFAHLCLGVRHTSNQTDSDVTCSRSSHKGKITEKY